MPWNKMGADRDLVRIKSHPRTRAGKKVRTDIIWPRIMTWAIAKTAAEMMILIHWESLCL
jgi:hypothetical protein